MARLPQPGKDVGTWGIILNDFLNQSHNDDGSIKDNVVTPAALAGNIPQTKIANLQDDISSKVNTSDLALVATSGLYVDLTDKPTIPSALSNLADDSTHRLVTDTEKGVWDGKQAAMGSDDNYITDAEKSNLHAPHSDDQDLTGLVHTNRTALDAVSGTNTGDETNSTIKTKLGTDLTDKANTADLDEVATSGITDDSIGANKCSFITKSVNLFNRYDSTINLGHYIGATGAVETSSTYYITHRIYVAAGTQITISYAEIFSGACYKADGTFISKIGTSSGNSSPFTFTAPALTAYCLINGLSATIATDMVIVGATLPSSYVPYSIILDSTIAINNSSITNLSNANIAPNSLKISNLSGMKSNIAFDKYYIADSYYTGGTFTTLAGYYIYKIPVADFAGIQTLTYTVQLNISVKHSHIFIKSDNTYINQSSTGTSGTITSIPALTAYILIQGQELYPTSASTHNTMMIVISNTTTVPTLPSPYVSPGIDDDWISGYVKAQATTIAQSTPQAVGSIDILRLKGSKANIAFSKYLIDGKRFSGSTVADVAGFYIYKIPVADISPFLPIIYKVAFDTTLYRGHAFFTAIDTFISPDSGYHSGYTSLTIPSIPPTAAYVVINGQASVLASNRMEIYSGVTLPSTYVSPGIDEDWISSYVTAQATSIAQSTPLGVGSVDITRLKGSKANIAFNKYLLIDKLRTGGSGGSIITNVGYYIYKIPVADFVGLTHLTYTVGLDTHANYAHIFLNSDDVFISQSSVTLNATTTITTIPTGTAYILIQGKETWLTHTAMMISIGDSVPSTYISPGIDDDWISAYVATAFNLLIQSIATPNILTGKIAAFDGDSICAGATDVDGITRRGWAERIGVRNGMPFNNYGVGGATVTAERYVGTTINSFTSTTVTLNANATVTESSGTITMGGSLVLTVTNMTSGSSVVSVVSTTGCVNGQVVTGTGIPTNVGARHWISRNVTNMRSDADYVILEGGVNDASGLVPMGTITSGWNDTYDDTTFCGALESLFRQVAIKYVGKKIGYIIVHKMDGVSVQTNHNLYHEQIRTICKKWSIPYLDLFYESDLNVNITEVRTALFTDTWHPNPAGHDVLSYKIEAWMKTL